jgi:hypothetical protein
MTMKLLTTLLLISGVAAMPPTKPELAKPTVVELYKRVDPTGVRSNIFYHHDGLPNIFMLCRNAIEAPLGHLAIAITWMKTVNRVNVDAAWAGATRYVRIRQVQSYHSC